MKKLLLFLFSIFLLSSVNTMGVSLDFTSDSYVGFMTPGSPADEQEEADYINTLTTLPAGGGPAYDLITEQTYDRQESSLSGPFPIIDIDDGWMTDKVEFDPELTGGVYTYDASYLIDYTDYIYVLGKYDGQNDGSHVWYAELTPGGFVDIPALGLPYYKHPNDPDKITQYGLSHVTVFSPSPVPEPATMLLLGTGLIGLAGFRRKFKK